MSRTKRAKRPQMNLGKSLADHQYKDGTVRDGTPTHPAKSCEHHGGCPHCEGNRTIQAKRLAAIKEDYE